MEPSPSRRLWIWIGVVHGAALVLATVMSVWSWTHDLEEVVPRLAESFARLDACVRRDAPASATWGEVLRVRLDEVDADDELRACAKAFVDEARSIVPAAQWRRSELEPLASALDQLVAERTDHTYTTLCRPAAMAAASLGRIAERIGSPVRVAVPDCAGQLARTPVHEVVLPRMLRESDRRKGWLSAPWVASDGALTYVMTVDLDDGRQEQRWASTIDGTSWDVFDGWRRMRSGIRLRGDDAWVVRCDAEACRVAHASRTAAVVRDDEPVWLWAEDVWDAGVAIPDGVSALDWVEGGAPGDLELLGEAEDRLVVVRISGGEASVVPLGVDAVGERKARRRTLTRAGDAWVLTEVHLGNGWEIAYRACRVPSDAPCELQPLGESKSLAPLDRVAACHDGEDHWVVSGDVVVGSADGGRSWAVHGRLPEQRLDVRPAVTCTAGALYATASDRSELTWCWRGRCQVIDDFYDLTKRVMDVSELGPWDRQPRSVALATVDGRVHGFVGLWGDGGAVETLVLEGGKWVRLRSRRWSMRAEGPTRVEGVWLMRGDR